ncbi:MAG: tyrosine recombinase XerC [Coriobacteriia bacterium]|nr:tyrosine recombinase XerC [Coriobacteriia bacterium]
MDELINGFIEMLEKERRLSAHTLRAYRTDLEAFAAWCTRRGLGPDDIGQRNMRAFLKEMHAAAYSRRTINRRLSAVKGFFAWLAEHGQIAGNTLGTVSGPKQERRLPRLLNSQEIEHLLSFEHGSGPLAARDRAFLELLYASGARVSELAALKTADVDFDRHQVTLFGKGSKQRIVPLYDAALGLVRDYLEAARPQLLEAGLKGAAGAGPESHLFLSVRGRPLSADSLRKVFKNNLRRAGLDSSHAPHDVRHSFASDLIEGGADLRSVQEMLGHTSLQTTQIYTHLSIGHLKEAHHKAHPRG